MKTKKEKSKPTSEPLAYAVFGDVKHNGEPMDYLIFTNLRDAEDAATECDGRVAPLVPKEPTT